MATQNKKKLTRWGTPKKTVSRKKKHPLLNFSWLDKRTRLVVFVLMFASVGSYFLYASYAATATDTVVLGNRTIRLGDSIRSIQDMVDGQAAPLYQYPKKGDAEVFIYTNRNAITAIVVTNNEVAYIPAFEAKPDEKLQTARNRVRGARDSGRYKDMIRRNSVYREKWRSVAYAVEDQCKNDGTIEVTVASLKDTRTIQQVADFLTHEPRFCNKGIDHD